MQNVNLVTSGKCNCTLIPISVGQYVAMCLASSGGVGLVLRQRHLCELMRLLVRNSENSGDRPNCKYPVLLVLFP